MKIFAISDLHLSFANPKPMEKFGAHWKDHFEKIQRNWKALVSEDDVVLIAGDLSWGLKLADAKPDLDFVGRLPGRKVLIKGNHDYWWSGVSRLRKDASEGMYFIHNDVCEFDGFAVTGVRLWDFPFIRWGDFVLRFESEGWPQKAAPSGIREFDDEKIRRRELIRLELCFEKMRSIKAPVKILLTHFPPIGQDFQANELTARVAANGVNICVFGHLHSVPQKMHVDNSIDGVRYVLASCDQLDFVPNLLFEL